MYKFITSRGTINIGKFHKELTENIDEMFSLEFNDSTVGIEFLNIVEKVDTDSESGVSTTTYLKRTYVEGLESWSEVEFGATIIKVQQVIAAHDWKCDPKKVSDKATITGLIFALMDENDKLKQRIDALEGGE